jgi:methylthioribose-1-phosphate isomerase
MSESRTTVVSAEWLGDREGCLRLLDQTRLPVELVTMDCHTVESVFEAIRSLRVRGAPAIGIAAAYGVCVGLKTQGGANARERLDRIADELATSRPTAVNLFYALDRMKARARALPADLADDAFRDELLLEARRIHEEDRQLCHAIGDHGANLLADGWNVMTHCNAGGLATSEYGTALACFFAAQDQGKRLHVYVDETRPLLQGARLTAWELLQRRIPATLICDSMAAHVMRKIGVQAVVVGADRIAANGDTANKIGTYGLAVLAAEHGVPFYVAAPSTTFDRRLPDGDGIPIEERSPAEITQGFGMRTAPEGISVYNPAFDVTPARYIRGIITERGVIQPVTAGKIAEVLG